MAKSYFAILGISSGATADEIRSAYRRLAKEFHPDYYEGGSEKFRDIQEAYAVLGNSRRRREYKQNIRKVSPITPLRRAGYPEPEPLIPEQSPIDLGDVSPVRSYECTRCAGEGAISGEMPVSVAFPPGLTKDHAVMIPLDRFGIRNTHITVLFRPTGINPI